MSQQTVAERIQAAIEAVSVFLVVCILTWSLALLTLALVAIWFLACGKQSPAPALAGAGQLFEFEA